MKKILILDGNALIFRAFYATFNSGMSLSSNGVPTNAIYLFSSMILKLIENRDFDNIVVALDAPGKKFRHEEYHEYKANRKEVPPELKAQFEPIKEFLDICNITTIEIPGYEADDIIGTIAANAKSLDFELSVYTGDRDLLQLINSNTAIYMMHKGLSEVERFDENHLKEIYNIVPSQIIDLKALMGDTADNIPGVPGIGEKGAAKLIETYQTIDNLYANIDEISGKLQEKLINGKESAYLSYELATIYTKVAFDFSIIDNYYDNYDQYKLYDFMKRYNIKSLLRYGKEKADLNNIIVNNVTCISSALLKNDVTIYVDSLSENYHFAKLEGIYVSDGLTCEYIDAMYLPFDSEFIAFLEDNKIRKKTYDLKRASTILSNNNILLSGVNEDFMIANYLINYEAKTLNDLLTAYDITSKELSTKDSLDERIVKLGTNIANLHLLYNKIHETLEKQDNLDLYYNVELKLSNVLENIERNGVFIDKNLLVELENRYLSVIDETLSKIDSIVGMPININSPKQLADLLFDTYKLPSNKKRSTSAEALEELKDMHPIIPLILKYRKYAKLLNTYIDSFKTFLTSDLLIHCIYNQCETATGRLSSSNPNMQNLAVRNDEQKDIRKLIVPHDGYSILSLDYSQIELRILAILSGDETMLNAFNSGVDIHSQTASLIFNVPIENVSNDLRRKAKAINFGIVYGMSAFGLSNELGISIKEGNEIIESFFNKFPSIKNYLKSQIEFCEQNGYVETILKRRRYVPEIKSSNFHIKEFAKRVAMNTPIQGSAADIIKMAMCNVYDFIKDNKDIKMIMQIHDELVFEVKDEVAEKLGKEIGNIMQNAINSKIPLEVSMGIGKNGLEAK